MSDLGFNIHQQLGAYKLISLLGKGKSGEVWSAISEVDNQAVALKIQRPCMNMKQQLGGLIRIFLNRWRFAIGMDIGEW